MKSAGVLIAVAAGLPLSGCIPGSAASSYFLRGTVLDSTFEPVEGARVEVIFPPRFESQGNLADELTGNMRPQRFTGLTAKDGRFEVEAVAVHHMTVNIPGALLLLVTVVPVVALTPLTREDIPRWVWWIAAMPPPGQPPCGAQVEARASSGQTAMAAVDPDRHFVENRASGNGSGQGTVYDVGVLLLGGKRYETTGSVQKQD